MIGEILGKNTGLHPSTLILNVPVPTKQAYLDASIYIASHINYSLLGQYLLFILYYAQKLDGAAENSAQRLRG